MNASSPAFVVGSGFHDVSNAAAPSPTFSASASSSMRGFFIAPLSPSTASGFDGSQSQSLGVSGEMSTPIHRGGDQQQNNNNSNANYFHQTIAGSASNGTLGVGGSASSETASNSSSAPRMNHRPVAPTPTLNAHPFSLG